MVHCTVAVEVPGVVRRIHTAEVVGSVGASVSPFKRRCFEMQTHLLVAAILLLLRRRSSLVAAIVGWLRRG